MSEHHFNHFINYYPQNYWPYQAMQNDSLRHPLIQPNIQFVTKNRSNYVSSEELEEPEAIDETTNEMNDGEETIVIDESELEEDSSCITELWTHSDISKLLDILALNWELYKNNKTKFCASAAIKLGRNKTGKQVKAKLFNLRTKYTNEKKEVTGKATSKWPYLKKMDSLRKC